MSVKEFLSTALLAVSLAVFLAALMCLMAGYQPQILGGDGMGHLERAAKAR